jgi:hypothetical protein
MLITHYLKLAMDINTEEPLKALKAQILEYVELKTELTRLSLIEYVAKVASLIFAAIVGMLIVALIFLSIFIAMSFFIGSWLHSYGFGFLISGGVYLLLLWFFVAFGSKRLQKYMIEKIVQLTDNTNNE